MKKVLLGSTALVAAGLMAGPAFAQLELSISGNIDMHAGYASEDLDSGREEYGVTTDTTLNFNADGVADNGLEYGTRLNIDDNGSAFEIDETYVLLRGTFGEVRLGQDDPVASTLRFAVPAVGNGQADGDFGRYIDRSNTDIYSTDFREGGDENKIIYIGSFGDFQAGASFMPSNEAVADDADQDQGDRAGGGAQLRDVFSLGGNYQGELSGVAVGVSVGGNIGTVQDGSADSGDHTEYGVGAEVGFGAFTVGGFYIYSEQEDAAGNDNLEFNTAGFGATFSTGPWAFGGNMLWAEETESTNDEDLVVGVGVEYSLADGLTPYADLVYFDLDDGAPANNDNDGTVFLVGVTASF